MAPSTRVTFTMGPKPERSSASARRGMKPPQITDTERNDRVLAAQRRNELEAGRLAQPKRHFHEPSRLELLAPGTRNHQQRSR